MTLPYLDSVRGVVVQVDGVPVSGSARTKILDFLSVDGTYDAITGKVTIGPPREMTIRTPVRVATTGNLAATRSSNVLTANANGALASQDGVSLSVGNRVLVWQQTTGADNGIYTVTSLGSAGAPFVLTRATDANLSAHFFDCMLVPVQQGTTYANQRFQLTTNDPITLNSTSLAFATERGVLTIDIFTSNGTWTKRSGAQLVLVDVIGGGGGGGGGRDGGKGTVRQGATGGAGGARSRHWFRADDLSATEVVTVGAGGAGGAGGSGGGGDGGAGKAGSPSYFGATGNLGRLTAFGGGAGVGGSSASARSGGGGGGAMSVGIDGSTSSVAGGEPGAAAGTSNAGSGGGGCATGTAGTCSLWGGGAGGGVDASGNGGKAGGVSFFGGGGGGAGGGVTSGNATSLGGDGGSSGPTLGGATSGFGVSGGSGGTSGGVGADGVAGKNGAGTGGGGGGSGSAGVGGAGGAATVAGGGGGGGGAGTDSGGGAGGAGFRGEVRAYQYT